MSFRHLYLLLAIAVSIVFPSCESMGDNGAAERKAMIAAINAEPKGAYLVGRRYYKFDYRVWGYVRNSGEPWSKAKMIVLNEHQKMAPDREKAAIGSDNGFEYKLFGRFSGDTVYEPASNSFYPEFVLTGYQLISEHPAPIFREPGAMDPKRRILAKPY
jgi:hypothetical protein